MRINVCLASEAQRFRGEQAKLFNVPLFIFAVVLGTQPLNQIVMLCLSSWVLVNYLLQDCTEKPNDKQHDIIKADCVAN